MRGMFTHVLGFLLHPGVQLLRVVVIFYIMDLVQKMLICDTEQLILQQSFISALMLVGLLLLLLQRLMRLGVLLGR
jgi:hypothetical protein